MNIAEKYIQGLKKAYLDNNAKESWEYFENVIHGAAKEDIAKLKEEYPDIPDALINLLEFVDGTYWIEYQGEEIAFYFLGSDIDDYEYPYYLFSANQIFENKNVPQVADFSYMEIDDKITDNLDAAKWLNFSDCMNNGGTSSLYIDFTPSLKGKAGQVIRFLHDPDELKVIADSFDDYLKMLMDNQYKFINKETID